MRTTHTTVSRPSPGRRADAVAIGVEAAKLLERHGADDVRLFEAGTAGEASGTHVFVAEFASATAYGECSDEMMRDPEIEVLLDRLYGAERALTIESQSVATEIDLGRTPRSGRGRILEAYLSRVVPGRYEAALDLAARALEWVESRDAVNGRLAQLTVAGSLADVMVVSWEFESMAAWGATSDAWMSDPAAQAVMETLTKGSVPVTPVMSALYTEIPL